MASRFARPVTVAAGLTIVVALGSVLAHAMRSSDAPRPVASTASPQARAELVRRPGADGSVYFGAARRMDTEEVATLLLLLVVQSNAQLRMHHQAVAAEGGSSKPCGDGARRRGRCWSDSR